MSLLCCGGETVRNKKILLFVISLVVVIIVAAIICIAVFRHDTSDSGKESDFDSQESSVETTADDGVRCNDIGHNYVDGICTRCQLSQVTFDVEKIEFVIENNVVSSYSTNVFGGDFKVSIRINDGVFSPDYAAPKITWEFVGEDYGSKVLSDGTVSLTDFLGNITLLVKVESANILSAELPIVTYLDNINFESIFAITKDGYSQTYIEGDIFNKSSVSLWGECSKGIARIIDFSINENPLTTHDTEFVIIYDDLYTMIPIVVNHKTLQYIEIATPPDTIEYLDGQQFSKEGLVIRAIFEKTSELVTDFEIESTDMTVGMEFVDIRYTYNGITKTVKQSITVVPKKLSYITIDSSNVRKIYTQGDTFNPSGLVVMAKFEEFSEIEVFDYTYTTDVLTGKDTFVDIFYTVGGVTRSERIEIEVIKPYSKTSQIKVLSPADISILWAYSYITDDGIRVIDNTAYEAYGLEFDKVNGAYEIPLGAVVTATIKNPAIINVALNGLTQSVDYDEKTVSWIMGNAELVVIKSIEMAGNHSVIRFEGRENEQSFLYDSAWNGFLTSDNLQRLSMVFADTDDFYYTYIVNGRTLTYEELTLATFEANDVIVVLKNSISVDAKKLILHLDDDISYSIFISNTIAVENLPIFTKVRCDYVGWSLSPNGAVLTDEALTEYLAQELDSYHIYICWNEHSVDYSDEYIYGDDSPIYKDDTTIDGSPDGSQNDSSEDSVEFVGEWIYSASHEGQFFECKVVFRADGRFTYKLFVDSELNSSYSGMYSLYDNRITVLSVEANMNIPIPVFSDFNFMIEDKAVLANLIISSNNSLIFIPCQLKKSL